MRECQAQGQRQGVRKKNERAFAEKVEYKDRQFT